MPLAPLSPAVDLRVLHASHTLSVSEPSHSLRIVLSLLPASVDRSLPDLAMESGANWAHLLPDLLIGIAEELPYGEDLGCFAQVCTSWKSAAAEFRNKNIQNPKPSRFPCLMLTEDDGGDMRPFFLLSTRRIQKLTLPREARGNHCFSSRGWLLPEESLSSRPLLLRPYTGIQIQLPPFGNLLKFNDNDDDDDDDDDYNDNDNDDDDKDFRKLLLSSPDPEHFLVMVIWRGSDVLFCRSKDASWSITDLCTSSLSDFCYHNGMVYLCTLYGEILEWDVHGPNPAEVRLILPRTPHFKEDEEDDVFIKDRVYISSSCVDDDKLYLVQRGYWQDPGKPFLVERGFWFEVYEYSFERRSLIQVDGLGGKIALFVGFNSSFSLEADHRVIKPDCIYFNDDCSHRDMQPAQVQGKDMGIYNIRNRTFEPHFRESKRLVAVPIWVFDEPS